MPTTTPAETARADAAARVEAAARAGLLHALRAEYADAARRAGRRASAAVRRARRDGWARLAP